MKILSNIRQNQKGFTLIELLVVATIIVVLSAIGLVSFSSAGKSARNSKRKADLETVRQALVLYKSDNGEYPNGVTGSNYATMIATLSSGNYISDPTPVDPKDGQDSCPSSMVTPITVYAAASSTCGYTYSGTPSTFTLSAPLENEPTYTLTNP